MPQTKSALDPLALRHAFASFATGVTVITALDELGAAVDPPLVQWSLRINSGLHRTFVDATHFSVSVLAAHQRHIALQFASRAPDRFAGIECAQNAGEPPLIRGALAYFVCKKIADHRVGDHELFIGEVLHASAHEGQALLFHGSKFLTTR
jgi:flavin reductase (DIM6/NTAB) family NADH-FMN oxidoreductase RutF